MAEHSPGPWRQLRNCWWEIVDAKNEPVLSMEIEMLSVDERERAEVNARLAFLAPEMFDLCETMFDCIGDAKMGLDEDSGSFGAIDDIEIRLKALIAKVKEKS